MRQKLVEGILKISNVRQSPIAHDALLIKNLESGVKRRVLTLWLKFFIRQLHNELIVSPYDEGLLGDRHANTNNVIISDTMIRYLSPPQLHPMIDHHKIMCDCTICNTPKYFQSHIICGLRLSKLWNSLSTLWKCSILYSV